MIVWEERKHRNVCAYTFQVWLSNKNFVVVFASKTKLKRFHCHVLIALTHVYFRQANFITLSRFEIVKLRSFAFPRQWAFEYPSTKAANLVVKFAHSDYTITKHSMWNSLLRNGQSVIRQQQCVVTYTYYNIEYASKSNLKSLKN